MKTITEKYFEYVERHTFEPKFAECTIQFKDNGDKLTEQIIKLSCEVVEEDDDLIFYYATGIRELENLTKQDNGQDFVVLTAEFLDKLYI